MKKALAALALSVLSVAAPSLGGCAAEPGDEPPAESSEAELGEAATTTVSAESFARGVLTGKPPAPLAAFLTSGHALTASFTAPWGDWVIGDLVTGQKVRIPLQRQADGRTFTVGDAVSAVAKEMGKSDLSTILEALAEKAGGIIAKRVFVVSAFAFEFLFAVDSTAMCDGNTDHQRMTRMALALYAMKVAVTRNDHATLVVRFNRRGLLNDDFLRLTANPGFPTATGEALRITRTAHGDGAQYALVVRPYDSSNLASDTPDWMERCPY